VQHNLINMSVISIIPTFISPTKVLLFWISVAYLRSSDLNRLEELKVTRRNMFIRIPFSYVVKVARKQILVWFEVCIWFCCMSKYIKIVCFIQWSYTRCQTSILVGGCWITRGFLLLRDFLKWVADLNLSCLDDAELTMVCCTSMKDRIAPDVSF
jgi:hypothetical protein